VVSHPLLGYGVESLKDGLVLLFLFVYIVVAGGFGLRVF
jgi:hypothetical protein